MSFLDHFRSSLSMVGQERDQPPIYRAIGPQYLSTTTLLATRPPIGQEIYRISDHKDTLLKHILKIFANDIFAKRVEN